jgi:hypothetical protein
MAHYLFTCSHTYDLGSSGDLDDADLDDLIANPETAPGYAWCQACTAWRPVVDVVSAGSREPSGASGESTVQAAVADYAHPAAVNAQP